ncbi:MAG: MFS transporter, partial [Burkholderiaceae bacterium]|nr:MFS transporter [Burkholderiaceae bacterium]
MNRSSSPALGGVPGAGALAAVDFPAGKGAALAILLLCQVGAMAVWFSSTAVIAQIQAAQPLSGREVSLLTSSVQLGFVVGTLLSAALSLADRWEPRRLFALSALTAAGATMALAFLEPAGLVVYALRFLTGMCMAGVYPVGMRLAATWARGDLGLLVGLLVGALALGSASPHIVSGLLDIDWRWIYVIASVGALLSGLGIRYFTVGPRLQRAASIDMGRMLQAWRNPSIRLANLGYLGHMWELYAMWAWLCTFLTVSFAAAGISEPARTAAIL